MELAKCWKPAICINHSSLPPITCLMYQDVWPGSHQHTSHQRSLELPLNASIITFPSSLCFVSYQLECLRHTLQIVRSWWKANRDLMNVWSAQEMFYDDSVGVHTLVYTHAPFYTAHKAYSKIIHSKSTFAYHTHYWSHTFKHFCLSSTKNSGPQARHLLNSSETTNIIFMLPLNPSWGSQNEVDSSMKQSKELWNFFFASIWFSVLWDAWLYA